MTFSTPRAMVSFIESRLSRRGNCGDAKNASRTDLVFHALNAGGQLRTRKFGLTPSSSISPAWPRRSMMSWPIEGAALEWTSPRSTVFDVTLRLLVALRELSLLNVVEPEVRFFIGD